MKKIRIALLLMIILALTSCNYPTADSKVTPSAAPQETTVVASPPQAWIDFPAEGEQIPFEPYQVIFHGSDTLGVNLVEFSVNGVVEISQSIDANTMPVGKREWTPPEPGEYTIQIRMQNTAGEWSEYATVNVTVLEATATEESSVESTVAEASAETSEPTKTATQPKATAVIEETSTVVPTAITTAAGAATVTVSITSEISVNEVKFSGSCVPEKIEFKATVTDPSQVYSVVLFTRMREYEGAGITPWKSVRSLPTVTTGVYGAEMDVTVLPDYNTFSKSQVLYQYVATAYTGEILGRSDTYSDLIIERCP